MHRAQHDGQLVLLSCRGGATSPAALESVKLSLPIHMFLWEKLSRLLWIEVAQ